MDVLKVSARNFRSWRVLDYDIPGGATAITGANGAGKSTIVSLIDIALFGARGSWPRLLTRGIADTECEVACVFEHEGRTYRARRTYSARGAGKSSFDFEVVVGSTDLVVGQYEAPVASITDWEPLTAETAAATQESVEELIGVSRDTFRASAFLRQGDGAAFTEAQPRDRKQLLADVLGLERYARYQAAAGSLLAKASAAHALAETQYQLCDERASKLGEASEAARAVSTRIDEIGEEDARCQDRLRLADAEWSSYEADCQAYLTRAAEYEAANRDFMRLVRVQEIAVGHADEARGMEATLALAVTMAARLDPLDEEERAYDTAYRAWHDAKMAATNASSARGVAEFNLSRLVVDDAVCGTCGQPLATPDAVARVEAERARAQITIDASHEIEAEFAAMAEPVHREGLREERREAAAYAARLPDIKAKVERRAEYDAAVLEAEEAVAVAAERLEQQRALSAMPAPIEPKTDRVGMARACDEARRALRTALEEKGRVAAQLEDARAAVTALAERREAYEEAGRVAATYRFLREAYGTDGIPALILENAALPAIEHSAAEVLDALGAEYRIELRTQRATSSGGVRDVLDIVVLVDGEEAFYEDFSGGERTRLNLALRIGLARLLAARRGADVRCLIIDEPEFLDADGVERLAGFLGGLGAEFSRILVISHVPGLRDAFPGAVVEVARGADGYSVIR